MIDPLIRKLTSIAPLTVDEEAALGQIPTLVSHIREQQDFVREGDRPNRSALLLDGFVVASKITRAGKRQITSIYVPGDIPDLHSLHIDTIDMTLTTLVPSTVAFIPHEALRDLCSAHPQLCFALWRTTLIDASIFREWVVNTGQRAAVARAAHIMCELLVRLRAVGLADGDVIDFPMTQAEFGEALGLSPVHVNRVLQDLRSRRLIELKGRRLTVIHWGGLCGLAEFDPTYLHLRAESEGAAKPSLATP